MRKITTDYDGDSDMLSVQVVGRKSSFSVDTGDLIIDFDSKKEVVCIEFLNASRMLSIISKKDITKDLLKNIKKCDLVSQKTGNTLVVRFVLELSQKVIVENSITVPLISQEKLVATV